MVLLARVKTEEVRGEHGLYVGTLASSQFPSGEIVLSGV